MFAKVEIVGTLEVVTGLHIGGNSAFAAIGAVDAPVITDVRSGDPIIPGSSLKGKMRTLLAKQYNEDVAAKPDDDAECLTNLFGSAKKGKAGKIKAGRLLFSDLFLSNKGELKKVGIDHMTEVKFENTISRTTAVANPRQIERVIRGAEFGLNLIYEVKDEETMIQDFEILKNGFKLLQYDYLGGSGSRGYGKIHLKDLEAYPVIGEVSEAVMEQCNELLQEI